MWIIANPPPMRRASPFTTGSTQPSPQKRSFPWWGSSLISLVDGYVWLDGLSGAGLGAHLYQALEGKVAVIGVAKTRFAGAGAAVGVVRGRSTRPLFITAVGMDAQQAAEHVRSMHSPDRILTLLKRVDSLARRAG